MNTSKDNVLYSDNETKVNLLNQYFASVFTKDDGLDLPSLDLGNYPSIPKIMITVADITKLLKGLKSTGPDKIPGRLLKPRVHNIKKRESVELSIGIV